MAMHTMNARPVAYQVRQRRSGVPARTNLDCLRVLLTSRGCKIPLSLELLLPSCPPRLHGVAAKVTAQLAKSFTRVSKTLFEIFVHSGILTETGTHYVQICTLLPHLRQ
jgi:hypothetical protein